LDFIWAQRDAGRLTDAGVTIVSGGNAIWSVPRPRERKVFAQRCFHIPGATAIVDLEIAEGATVDHFEQGVPIVENGGITTQLGIFPAMWTSVPLSAKP